MQDELRQQAVAAAEQATAQLESLAFGAIDKVLLADVTAAEAEGAAYFTVSWSIVSMGMEDNRVNMVVLPEFLEEDGVADLGAQMAAYVVDKVLTDAQEG